MTNLCFSSETYMIDVKDIAILKDSNIVSPHKDTDNKVIILIGDMEHNIPDTLLCGRILLDEAIKNNQQYIPVNIAFISKIKRYDVITPFIKKLRGKYKIWSSNIYHTTPVAIRKMKIERCFRTKETAFNFTNPLYRSSESERMKRYEDLYNSMKQGYDDNYPIDIMLLRMLGIKDNVNNGHHRMGVAIECGLPRISVRFSAAGQAPWLLRPLLKVIANIAIRIKQSKKN